MRDATRLKLNRRTVLKSSLAGSAAGPIASAEQEIRNVNTASSPFNSITDMRYAIVVKPGPSPFVLIRIDTNQGVYGLGEMRDIARPPYAMVLKSRILGENPLRIDCVFQKIAQIRRQRAPGWRRLCGGDGAPGDFRQGIQHSRLSDASWKVARRDSHLRRHHRVDGFPVEYGGAKDPSHGIDVDEG
jgi:hypothetical protein